MMNINKIKTIFALLLMIISSVGCNNFLEKEPFEVSPVVFFNNEDQLDAYAIARYGLLPTSLGGFGFGPSMIGDNNTDNQTATTGNDFWLPGTKLVPHSYTDATNPWYWYSIYEINYFFEQVLPKQAEAAITGSADQINHYIGEMYFFRAFEYFKKLKMIGDIPIILETLPDQAEPLLEASVRQPRNQVARQIIKDLDLAIGLLKALPDGGSNRISKNVAQLFKSRVALYEASWERNFAGTAFVPNGEGWPGKATHPNYEYNAEAEIAFFLDQALAAAEIVADAVPQLTANPGDYDYANSTVHGQNPYYEMWGEPGQGLKNYPEVLLFRSYDLALGLSHGNVNFMTEGAWTGFNNQYMENFLMRNGLPIYAQGSGYGDDREISDVKFNRDSRLQLFVKAPGEILNDGGALAYVAPEVPLILNVIKNPTGYAIRKGASIHANEWVTGGAYCTTGDILFRATEAYLNYIEAYYLKHSSISGKADTYWRAIRTRANVDTDYNKTIAATVMAEEAKVDLAAYTAGQLVDATLYNIRRERRSEFIAEGFRWDDLKRYRALDQLITKRTFMPQGFNLWGHYASILGDKLIPYSKDGSNVSANENFVVNGETMNGTYLYPFRAQNSIYFEGYKFAAAHYLSPIATLDLLNSSADNVENSMIYQNPGWGTMTGDKPQAIPRFN